MHLAAKCPKNLYALCMDIPRKHDRASTCMESMVASIKLAHDNAVQREMNE